jgi:hypothetical protein
VADSHVNGVGFHGEKLYSGVLSSSAGTRGVLPRETRPTADLSTLCAGGFPLPNDEETSTMRQPV